MHAQAATVRATIGVSARVIEDCTALLNSSTTIIAASYACQGSPVATVLSPTVNSTSLAVLAPMAFSGQISGGSSSAGSASSSSGRSGGSAGGIELAPIGSITVGGAANSFVATTDETEDRVVTITY